MRMPTYGLPQWKRIIDCICADGGNLLLLWMAGAFRSKKFPITWKFNEEHANVRDDFGRELIEYARTQGIRVLLGFAPFGYDGVNQYPIEHPELTARKPDGSEVDEFGIYCWGHNLCPSKAESQRFMLEYVREMAFEFYPNADGLLIESSDYAACHCPDCRGLARAGSSIDAMKVLAAPSPTASHRPTPRMEWRRSRSRRIRHAQNPADGRICTARVLLQVRFASVDELR